MNLPVFESGALCLEFLYSDLRLDRDQDSDDVVEAIHNHVVDHGYPLLESEITAVQFWPNKRYPKKVYLFFSTQRAKDFLHQRGMNLLGCAITFDEPGKGLMRIEIQNVLHSVPNHVISRWLSQYGEVVDVKHDQHKFKNGRRITWGTGIRFGWVKHVESKIPPHASVEHNGRTLHMSIWYFGITEMHCRHCRMIVPKDHSCELAPRKRCRKCNSENHLQHECTVGKSCYRCQSTEHLSGQCPLNKKERQKTTMSAPPLYSAKPMNSRDSAESNQTVQNMNPFTGEIYTCIPGQDKKLVVNNENFPRISGSSDSETDEPKTQRLRRRTKKHSKAKQDAPEGETGITRSVLEAKQVLNGRGDIQADTTHQGTHETTWEAPQESALSGNPPGQPDEVSSVLGVTKSLSIDLSERAQENEINADSVNTERTLQTEPETVSNNDINELINLPLPEKLKNKLMAQVEEEEYESFLSAGEEEIEEQMNKLNIKTAATHEEESEADEKTNGEEEDTEEVESKKENEEEDEVGDKDEENEEIDENWSDELSFLFDTPRYVDSEEEQAPSSPTRTHASCCPRRTPYALIEIDL